MKNTTDLLFLLCIFCYGLSSSRYVPLSFSPEKTYLFEGRCQSCLSGNNYLLQASSHLFYLSNFQTDTTYRVGDVLCFHTRISPLPENSNPGEFSYTRYLKQKNVYYRLFPLSPIQKTREIKSIRSVSEQIRYKLLEKTANLFPDTNCRSFIAALCLGFKNDLDPQIQNLFITTGTIHLLSVSGLHTGAIYLLVVFFLQHLGISSRKSKLFTLPLLWIYACLTGLPPSVIRAATILSFITIGNYAGKDYTPLNAVAASAFLTLIVSPEILRTISFLMSYCAYTGILILYPLLNKSTAKLPKFAAKLGYSCHVTLAAQIPTLPISAYFFHTVNVTGFLINLIAVPLSTLILYTAFILLFLPLFIGTKIAIGLTFICRFLFRLLNSFQPLSWNISDVYPTFIQLLLAYLLIGILILLLKKFTRNILKLTFLLLLVSFCYTSSYNYKLSHRQEIVVFHIYRHSSILVNYNGHYSFIRNTAPDLSKIQPYIRQNKLRALPSHSGLLTSELQTGNSFIRYRSQHISIPTGRLMTPVQVCIITNNLLPETVFGQDTTLYPLQIIADASNTSYHLKIWKNFCKSHNLLFSSTSECGGIVLPLK